MKHGCTGIGVAGVGVGAGAVVSKCVVVRSRGTCRCSFCCCRRGGGGCFSSIASTSNVVEAPCAGVFDCHVRVVEVVTSSHGLRLASVGGCVEGAAKSAAEDNTQCTIHVCVYVCVRVKKIEQTGRHAGQVGRASRAGRDRDRQGQID